MGIFQRFLTLFEKRTSNRLDNSRFWINELVGDLKAGVYISPDKALNLTAVYACVRIIAESIAQLPIILYERQNENKKAASENPKYTLLHDKPNNEQTPFEFKEMFVGHAALRGNSFAGIEYTTTGDIANLIPLNPAKMEVKRENGIIIYIYTDELGKQIKYPADRIWHFKGLSRDGIVGLSPISLFRESLGLTKAAEDYAAQYFGNNAVPGAVLKHPQTLKESARKNLKESLAEYASSRRHETLVLEEGMSWEQIGISNKDSQFLESRNFQIEEICRMFNVPSILIHHPDKASTYASAEQFALNFVKYCILPWCKRFEQSANRALLTESEQEKYFYEFKLDSLLRGDTKSRYDAYAVGRQWGWLSANDIRRFENLDEIDNGDEYITNPQNITGKQGNIGGETNAS